MIRWLFRKSEELSQELPKDWYRTIINEINDCYTKENDDDDDGKIKETSYGIDRREFGIYLGKITDIYPEGNGRIDHKYIFTKEAAIDVGRLERNDRVKCLVRKVSEDKPVEIYKIEAKEENTWDVNDFESDPQLDGRITQLDVCIKWLNGEVKTKLNGEIFIETKYSPKPLKLGIADSGCSFNPMIGDQVKVEAKLGSDPNKIDNCTIIEYYSLKAIDEKNIKSGKIKLFKKKLAYGLVEYDSQIHIFFLDVLQHSDNQNMVPNVGDIVSCTAITSHQYIGDEEFFWRCINLVKIGSAVAKNVVIPQMPLEMDESDDEIDDDMCGIKMTKNDALKVKLDANVTQKQIRLTVENTSNQSRKISPAKYHNAILESQIGCIELTSPRTIPPGKKFVYHIDIMGKIRGIHKLKVDFQIDGKHLIRRCFTIDVKSVDENATMVNISRAQTKKIYTKQCDIVRGQAPISSPHFIDNRLERFEIPRSLFDDWTNNGERYEIDDVRAEELSHLTPTNYGPYFRLLLHYEEIYMRHEFRMYDQDRGHFHKSGEYLEYQMNKTVSECRPSITIGDMIFAESLVRDSDGQTKQYQGYIHRTQRKSLLLKFDDAFHNSYRGEDMKLVFKFARTKFVKPHNAIDRIAKKMQRNGFKFLFPTNIKTSKLQMPVQLIDGQLVVEHIKNNRLKWFNENLNEIQKRAVVNVLRGEVKMCPYLVFGPPGTGKTSTIIEIILQLFRKGNSRLLVAAPSNSAANLITKLLADCGQLEVGQFARIAGRNSIERDQIPDDIQGHCITTDIAAPRSRAPSSNPTENAIRNHCNSEDLSLYRILISTCSSFGSLLCMKFNPGHFTHAIIDEAGQCTEPEIAIPISLIDKDDGQIILAGDPHQLGPVVLSPVAKKCGLSKSLLSRLLDFLPYHSDVGRNGGYDERMVTQLLHNYRSLPSILNTYSNLSYESKLIANISSDDSNEQRLLDMVRQKISNLENPSLKLVPKYGVHFIGVNSEDESPPYSTSWRNLREALTVITIAHQLYFECGLSENDIGIITPYTLQKKEIAALGEQYFEDPISNMFYRPKIGSVEDFQGQERNVIIISTVRSHEKYISHDGKYGLGFINNKNRLNVAISRARAILIIVGNPNILSLDDNWRQIIYDCYINNSYSGCRIPDIVRSHMD